MRDRGGLFLGGSPRDDCDCCWSGYRGGQVHAEPAVRESNVAYPIRHGPPSLDFHGRVRPESSCLKARASPVPVVFFRIVIISEASACINRGRDARHRASPAQILRPSGIPAYGSHLGYLTRKVEMATGG